jgi:hypothetical protein
MSSLIRYALASALVLGLGLHPPVNGQTIPQSKTIRKAPTGSISGRITVKGKGRAGIVVGVMTREFGPERKPLFKAVTDQDGNYRITDLPVGNYQVAPVAPVFVVSDFNLVGLRGKALILSEGENVEGLNFSLVSGGVITGKVRQADGLPVVEERITITPVEQSDARRPGTPMASSFQTDDLGVYRVFGLPAGRYKISIGQDKDTLYGGGRQGRPTYERVFYPDVTNPDEAKVVELGEGSEATNIDITVGSRIKGFAADGIVLDGVTNQPLADLRFGLQRIAGENDAFFIGSYSMSNRLGEFRFENLTPGKYSVFIFPQPNSDLRGDPVAFEVVDQDVNGIVIRSSKGASVAGTVVLEGNHDKTVQSRMAQLHLNAYVRGEENNRVYSPPSSINADGSFRLGGFQAGVLQFHLSAQNPGVLTGFVLSRVERDGVVLPGGLEIKSAEQISGVRIVVVYASGSIRGTVKMGDGPLPTGARLMVRLEKPGDPSFVVHRNPQDVDARGHFALEGVPAGSYDLWIHSSIPGLRSGRTTKQSVSVTEGSVTDVEVVIDLEANTSPKP